MLRPLGPHGFSLNEFASRINTLGVAVQRLAYCVLEKPNIQSNNSTELKTAAFAALCFASGNSECFTFVIPNTVVSASGLFIARGWGPMADALG